MSGIVTFDYARWAAAYPEISATVSLGQAQSYFNRATMQLDNTATSVVSDAAAGGAREMLLWLLVSHLAVLGARDANQVGRINDATQGSVHVAFENQPAVGTAAWYQQTRYGSEYWAATASLRTMLYVSAYQPFAIPYPAT